MTLTPTEIARMNTAAASPLSQRPSARALRSPLLIVGLLTLFGAALRFYHLGFKPLWLDEAVLYQIATGSLADVLAKNAQMNSAPPLYAILVNLVMHVGDSAAMLRLVSVLPGICAIPASYLLARHFTAQRGAYFAALLVTISTTQIGYSQQLREYSLTFLLSALILHLFVDFLSMPSRKHTAALALLIGVGLLTQYGSALLLVALNLIFLFWLIGHQQQRAPLLLHWILIQAAAGIAAALVYVTALGEQWQVGGFAGTTYLAHAYWDGSIQSLVRLAIVQTGRLLRLTAAHTNLSGVLPFIFDALLIVALSALGTFSAWVSRHRLLLGLLVATIGVAFMAALLRLYPYTGGRQVIYLTPLLYVMMAVGFEFLLRKRVYVGLMVVAALLALGRIPGVYAFLQYAGDDNITPIMRALYEGRQPNDAVYVHGLALPQFEYYTRHAPLPYTADTINSDDVEAYARQIDTLAAQNERLWLVFSHCFRSTCDSIVERVAVVHPLELVASDNHTRLYLIE